MVTNLAVVGTVGSAIDVHSAGGFQSPARSVDATNHRLVIGVAFPTLVLDSTSRASGDAHRMAIWHSNMLGIDETYICSTWQRLQTRTGFWCSMGTLCWGDEGERGPAANLTIGRLYDIELAQGWRWIQNAISFYAGFYHQPDTACQSHALVVLRGAEIDPVTRDLVQAANTG
jgi:hypothetical protein